MTEPGIPLADLVDAVRAELEAAAINARDCQLQFEVQDIQLEVAVTTTGSREGEGGIKVWVLNIGAKATKGASDAHKVTMRLTPVTPAGTKFKVNDVAAQKVRRK